MTRQRIPPGMFARDQGGVPRYYARVPGRGRVALCPSGQRRATSDLEVAIALYAQLTSEEQKRTLRGVHGLPAPTTLAEAARDYLIVRAEEGVATEQWLEGEELRLTRATEQLGGARELSTITVADGKSYAAALRRRGLSGGTIRHHLNSLGALYRLMGEQQRVAPGYNPISLWRKKPTAQRREARWLESADGALLLEAARLYQPKQPKGGRPPVPFIYPLVATFLLTGGREAEVLGLEVSDVSFDGKTVTFRPNAWRRLKTATSHRVMPLPPQLEEVLRPYVFGERPPSKLLFPSFVGGAERLVTDWRKVLDAVAMKAGWKAGEIRSKMFRHTFCAAALQLLDGDEPISVHTVSRWMGHGGTALVNRTYSHLGTVRHRAKVLEYRVEQHAAILGDRLGAVQRGRGNDSENDSVLGAPETNRVS